MTTTHYVGDGCCPGGHRDPAELVDHLNRELARIDIPALARRLTKAQRRVLAEVPAGNLRRRELFHAGHTSYVNGWVGQSAVTTTARALIRHGLILPGARVEGTWHSVYELNAVGRAVLDHLTTLQSDRGSVGRDVAGFLGLIAFMVVALALCGNWSSW